MGGSAEWNEIVSAHRTDLIRAAHLLPVGGRTVRTRYDRKGSSAAWGKTGGVVRREGRKDGENGESLHLPDRFFFTGKMKGS